MLGSKLEFMDTGTQCLRFGYDEIWSSMEHRPYRTRNDAFGAHDEELLDKGQCCLDKAKIVEY